MDPEKMIRRIHPAGWPFIGIAAVVTIMGANLISDGFFFFGVILTAWVVYFFRDPPRVTPTRPGLIVSPADGTIVAIEEVEPEADLGLGTETRTRISIFLNIFDVHVNRIPAEGVITARNYRAGKFLHAASDKASADNERMALVIDLTEDTPHKGQKLGVVQIAGLIARRIICDAREGDRVTAGKRYGIIRFGSRADIYLPHGMTPLVIKGQYMLGGETILADCLSTEAKREGEIR